MSMEDLRAQMGKGNPKPAPGPDGWEKWALRRCNDEFLSLILLLCNRIITDNYFPNSLKERFISPLYKKNNPSDPATIAVSSSPITCPPLSRHGLLTNFRSTRGNGIYYDRSRSPLSKAFREGIWSTS
jgi:hypothetical protein